MGCAARAMGFATEGTEGTETSRVTQRASVVSVILCGLSGAFRAVHLGCGRLACGDRGHGALVVERGE